MCSLHATEARTPSLPLTVHLRKYYLDLLTDDGRAFVWHWAALRWPCRRVGPFRLSQASELLWDGRGSTARRTLRCGRGPQEIAVPARGGGSASELGPASTTLRWSCPALAIDGAWRGPAAAPLELLPERPGAVRWSCLQPRSTVEVHRAGERLRGTGYAERLDMDLAPWRLPIDILRWGRVTSGRRSVVWIGWHGPRPLTMVLVDGVAIAPTEAASVGDALVAWPGGRVVLEDRVTIREERVGDALQVPFSGLRHILPRRVVDARETRWLSQAHWTEQVPGHGAERSSMPLHGVALHERVEFLAQPVPAREGLR